MNPDADHDQADMMAALLNAMYEAPAYKAPMATPEPVPDVPSWVAEPAAAVILPEVDNGPDWERIIPRIWIGTTAVLITTAGVIVAANWHMFVRAVAILIGILAGLVVLWLLFGGRESVTVTGRGLKVWRS